MKNLITFKNLVILFVALTILNLLYVNLKLIQKPQSILETNEAPNKTSTDIVSSDFCPQSCIAQIKEATAPGALQSITPSPASESDETPTPTPETTTTAKEFFIPFGSGSSSAGDWQDVPGVQATIDSENYPEIKEVTFEATVRIPTGNEVAYIRLLNATDKHPVWASEISWEGGGTKFLTKTFTLDSGSKTYQVQMKTSLKFQAIFDQARIHIITY